MENELENDNSTNVEEVETTDSENGNEDTEETTEEYTEREKQLYARLKKLEAEAKSGKTTKETKTNKSNDFGYDVKAYLKASGIDSTEFDFVKQEMKDAGVKDVDSLLANKYFQSRLEEHRELTKTAEAIPTGKRSGGVATDNVEYWLSKPIEEVPQEHRRAVVNAREEREKNKGKFYNG